MSEIRNTNGSNNDISNTLDQATNQAEQIYMPDYIDTIFQRLNAQDVEQFYKIYQFWSLQPRLKTLQAEIEVMQQAITDNDMLAQQLHLSPIALASLAQLQASGVNDLDLLDRMLERGETWLDHTMQLLEHCEELDLIGGDYTQWCEHALEGAYDWIESINATKTIDAQENEGETPVVIYEQQSGLQEVTEEQLLQKLMSDGEATDKIPALSQSLSETEQIESSFLTRKITRPLQQPEQEEAEPSLSSRKITRPLLLIEAPAETEIPETPSIDNIDIVQFPLETDDIHPDIDTTATDEVKDNVATPEEDAEESITQKMHVSRFRTVKTSKGIDVQEMEDVAGDTDTTDADQTRAESVRAIENRQESEKPQIRKVRHRGFWHLLGRLIAFILRR